MDHAASPHTRRGTIAAMKRDPRLISVVIPVRDGERHLAEAIESIFAQCHRPLDVIVVDDGSTDGTAGIAQRFPEVRYVRQDKEGQAAARNRGVGLAGGELLAFLDADDVWMKRKLELQLAALDADPSLDMVFGFAEQFIDADGVDRLTLPESRRILPARLPSALLARREAFDRVGGFRAGRSAAEVVDWLARALDMGIRALTLDDVVFRRRIHGANVGVRSPDSRSDYLEVVGEALARRRSEKARRRDSARSEPQDR